MKTNRWFEAVAECQKSGTSYVLITVLSTSGSTPRESGTKMVVTDCEQFDTIGGGHLEHTVTRNARDMLIKNVDYQHVDAIPLSSKLGQCCGGATHILYEVISSHCQHLAVFGNGHVANALIPIIANLPLQIHWIDQRGDNFPNTEFSNVKLIETDDPVFEVNTLPNASWILVLTHNHQLDFDIVQKALKRTDLDFVGMIGSETKAKRFRTRLEHREFSEDEIARLVSPVGEKSIPGKKPIEVAISIAAQLVQKLHSTTSDTIQQPDTCETNWQQSKKLVSQQNDNN